MSAASTKSAASAAMTKKGMQTKQEAWKNMSAQVASTSKKPVSPAKR